MTDFRILLKKQTNCFHFPSPASVKTVLFVPVLNIKYIVKFASSFNLVILVSETCFFTQTVWHLCGDTLFGITSSPTYYSQCCNIIWFFITCSALAYVLLKWESSLTYPKNDSHKYVPSLTKLTSWGLSELPNIYNDFAKKLMYFLIVYLSKAKIIEEFAVLFSVTL